MEVSLIEICLGGLAVLIIFVSIVCALKCQQSRSVERLALNVEREFSVIKKQLALLEKSVKYHQTALLKARSKNF